jgi:hypothetical protein
LVCQPLVSSPNIVTIAWNLLEMIFLQALDDHLGRWILPILCSGHSPRKNKKRFGVLNRNLNLPYLSLDCHALGAVYNLPIIDLCIDSDVAKGCPLMQVIFFCSLISRFIEAWKQ